MAHKYRAIGVAAVVCLAVAGIALVFVNRVPDKPSDAPALADRGHALSHRGRVWRPDCWGPEPDSGVWAVHF